MMLTFRRQEPPPSLSAPEPLALPDMGTAAFLGPAERGPIWPQLVGSWQEFTHWFGPHIPTSCLAYAVDGYFRNGGRRCYVVRIVPADARTAAMTFSTLQVQAIGPGAWGNRVAVRVKESGSGRFRLTVRYWRGDPPSDFIAPRPRVVPDLEENYDHLSADPRSPDYVLRRLGRGQSRLIAVSWANERRRGVPRPRDFAFLRGGTDGSSITVADYEGELYAPPERRRGLAALRDVPEVSMIAAPDDTGSLVVQAAMVAHCNTPSLFRLALIAGPPDIKTVHTVSALSDTSRAAMFFPWLEVLDPLTKSPKMVPPIGHVAGILARLSQQQGTRAPWEEEAIQGILGAGVSLSDAECAGLVARRVNPIRDRSAWGERITLGACCTMSSSEVWRSLRTRRLADAVEKAVAEGTRWVVGRPNEPTLWDTLGIQISTFLGRLWRSGLLQGERSEEAYFVRCGPDTMTAEDLAEGRVIVEVGLAVVQAGRFITFRLVQSPEGAQIIELG